MFANNIKLGGPVNRLEGRITMQVDLERMEDQADRNLMKFSRTLLRMGRKSLCAVQGATAWPGSSSAEKALPYLLANFHTDIKTTEPGSSAIYHGRTKDNRHNRPTEELLTGQKVKI